MEKRHGAAGIAIKASGLLLGQRKVDIDRRADYVFALKCNHTQLHQEVIDWFEWSTARHFRDIDHTFCETVTKGHGRLEVRQCYALTDPAAFQALAYDDGWAGLLVLKRRQVARTKYTNSVSGVECRMSHNFVFLLESAYRRFRNFSLRLGFAFADV